MGSCAGTVRIEPDGNFPLLEPTAAVGLGSSAAAICSDGDLLLVLENSGTRIIRFSTALTVSDTIPLSERVTAPAGVSADRFHYYVFDDHRLYRMSKDNASLEVWLNNVRVAGLASFEPGRMLVSDDERNSIWFKGFFGESRLFISSAEVARPNL